jgi:hypothetical protein
MMATIITVIAFTCRMFARNMDAESKKYRGRPELWSPSTIRMFLSPAYF